MEYQIEMTSQYMKWFHRLKDRNTKNRILFRLDRIKMGNFGDAKQLSASLFELWLHCGKGLRIYYTRQNRKIVILLQGGDKSTQNADIDKAKKMIKELGNNHGT